MPSDVDGLIQVPPWNTRLVQGHLQFDRCPGRDRIGDRILDLITVNKPSRVLDESAIARQIVQPENAA